MTLEQLISGAWFWRGMAAALLAALPCAMVGVFLYLRRMSLVADALAHIALLGIVLAFLLTGSTSVWALMLGALITSAVASLLIQMLSEHKLAREDAAVGIVFTAMFALGVILLTTQVRGVHLDTHCALFGDVLGVSDASLWMLGVTAPLVASAIGVGWRWLALSSFDAGMARAMGVPVGAVQAGLLLLASWTTTACFEAVGAILCVAMMIVPAAFAHLLADRLRGMIGWALAHAAVSAVAGMVLSVLLNVSTSGMMVVVGGALYAGAFGWRRLR
jgi:manganese/zinc/iron transport system permease protein